MEPQRIKEILFDKANQFVKFITSHDAINTNKIFASNFFKDNDETLFFEFFNKYQNISIEIRDFNRCRKLIPFCEFFIAPQDSKLPTSFVVLEVQPIEPFNIISLSKFNIDETTLNIKDFVSWLESCSKDKVAISKENSPLTFNEEAFNLFKSCWENLEKIVEIKLIEYNKGSVLTKNNGQEYDNFMLRIKGENSSVSLKFFVNEALVSKLIIQ